MSPQEMFSCPYCSHTDGCTEAVRAPLAQKFLPHHGLRCLLSGDPEQQQAPPCDNCPDEDPRPATTHCKDCHKNVCDDCDSAIHSMSMQQPLCICMILGCALSWL